MAKLSDLVKVDSSKDVKMSVFAKAKLPRMKVDKGQFDIPEDYLIMKAERVSTNKINPQTGWDLKDDAGNRVGTGKHHLKLQVVNLDDAKERIGKNQSLDDLNRLTVHVNKDIPVDNFEPAESIVGFKNIQIQLYAAGTNGVDKIEYVVDDIIDGDGE